MCTFKQTAGFTWAYSVKQYINAVFKTASHPSLYLCSALMSGTRNIYHALICTCHKESSFALKMWISAWYCSFSGRVNFQRLPTVSVCFTKKYEQESSRQISIYDHFININLFLPMHVNQYPYEGSNEFVENNALTVSFVLLIHVWRCNIPRILSAFTIGLHVYSWNVLIESTMAKY